CTLDLECPAGSHCGSQGKCISLCTPGADCGEGMVCTAQGRCVQKPPEDTVPPPPAATSMPPLGDIGTGGTGGGGGGTGGSETCAKANVTFEKEIPNVMVVVDRSKSMESAFGASGSRWNVVRDALIAQGTGLIDQLQNEVRFGLTLYTSPFSFGGPGGGFGPGGGMGPGGGFAPGGGMGAAGTAGAGGAGSGAAPIPPGGSGGGGMAGASGSGGGGSDGMTCPDLIEVPIALNNLDAISQVYLPDDEEGGTPTGESLDVIWPKVAALDPMQFPGGKYIVLATDGDPNMCASINQDGKERSVNAVRAAWEAGITTFVISVGSDATEDHLRQLANIGQGYPADDPTNRFYPANDAQQLAEALQSIILGVRSCRFMLEGMIELDRASEGTVVLDGQELAYDDPDGWRVLSPTEIELVGAACEAVQKGATQIAIDFPCGVYVPPIPE
ncbi:MAG: vWA domain-containing protein, partial [Pseudomonadota bacterium]